MTIIKNLTLHLDDRGYLYEILRSDDEFFKKFGQYYVSATNPGVVKGFHKHDIQYDYVVCVSGQVKLVLIDPREDEPKIEEYHLGPLSPLLVVIEPGVYHGWQCVSTDTALIVNAASEIYDKNVPDEERVDPHDNPWGYVWGVVDK